MSTMGVRALGRAGLHSRLTAMPPVANLVRGPQPCPEQDWRGVGGAGGGGRFARKILAGRPGRRAAPEA